MRDKLGRYVKGNPGYRKPGMYKHSLETKRKISIGIKNHLPRTAFKKGQLKGDKSPLWKGGISLFTRTERMNIMSTTEYKEWRWNIFKRDNFTCQICGIKGGKLRANHIKRFKDYPELRIDINNGITICEGCDLLLVLNREREWESYFNFNLAVRKESGFYGK